MILGPSQTSTPQNVYLDSFSILTPNNDSILAFYKQKSDSHELALSGANPYFYLSDADTRSFLQVVKQNNLSNYEKPTLSPESNCFGQSYIMHSSLVLDLKTVLELSYQSNIIIYFVFGINEFLDLPFSLLQSLQIVCDIEYD